MRSKRNNNRQRGGEYAAFQPVKACGVDPNVEQYKAPCGSLVNNQFGLKETVGYYAGGSRKNSRNNSRRKNNNRRNNNNNQKGGCGDAKADCMGKTIPGMGDMTNYGSSELAWFYRNTYGATPSTNELTQQKGGNRRNNNSRTNRSRNNNRSRKNNSQRGGNYFLDVSKPTLGGLSQVGSQYDLYPPSFKNLQVTSTDPNTVRVTNIVQRGGSRNNSRKNNRRNNNQRGGGNFSPDMMTRAFDCKQPSWCDNCV
jgi:hypothetical protein